MKRFRVVIAVIILAILALAYFYYLSSKNDTTSNNNDNNEISDVSKIINKDLESSYPATPREVVRLYSNILECYYNEEYTDEELVEMTYKARTLFDEELLEKNPYDEYYNNLTSEIELYQDSERIISSYIISKNSEVIYKTFENKDYAMVECIYYVNDKDGHYRTSEEYTLRKDEQGLWKILYWELIEDGDENDK